MIQLRQVEVNNLKKIDLDLSRGELIAICGVSGSGKTSLALDTLYAEGQRRYIESFSAYTRQFLEKLEKPAAERIDGLPAAIAIADRGAVRGPRTTVGTATEAIDYLRLLFARVGRLFCLKCGKEVRQESPESVATMLAKLPPGVRFLIGFPVGQPCQADGPANQGGADEDLSQWAAHWQAQGFARGIVSNRTVELTAPSNDESRADHEPLVLVDRLTAGGSSAARVQESLETAFAAGEGRCVVLIEAERFIEGSEFVVDERAFRRLAFSSSLRCETCNLDYPYPEPRLFNFNSPLGACPMCEGAGETANSVCPACHGDRLRPEALATRIAGKNIADVSRLTVRDDIAFINSLTLSETEQAIAAEPLRQVKNRLAYLHEVGLGYLSLDRPLAALSAGESRRVQLTSALGSNLVNLLYVLDEPTAGLHPADTPLLVKSIMRLRDRGNTVVAVEHSAALLAAADTIVEIGPAAGERGGQVTFQGGYEQMLAPGASVTGEYIAGRQTVSASAVRRATDRGSIKLCGARGHNLQNLDVSFPLGVLCLVTGVSGAGKSSLVVDTLYGALQQRLGKEGAALPFDSLEVDGRIDDCLLIDREPVSRSPRSNPVTYIKAFDDIRTVFAETPEARLHNYTAGHFSFNVDGGRCPTCQGDGRLAIDMQFLPDVSMVCPDCTGTRYRKEILAATYRGRTIAEVLSMTAREAFPFFRGQTKVQGRLKKLIDVGLDYIRLGQPANTHSHGESQRLRMAAFLSSARRSRTLFLMEEPATGLHFADVATLIECLHSLLGVGHSLIVIDHNVHLMRAADHIIDLGPGPADAGGKIVCEGTPEAIAACSESATGRALAE